MPAVFLNDRSLLRIIGADAESFLQNLITTDLGALAADEARPGALLTPQGKIMFDFMIWRDGDGFVVETDSVQGEALLKRLSMYRLRAAVEITASDEQGVTVSWGDAGNGGYADSRFAKAGVALQRLPGAHGDDPVAIYDAARIAAGVPSSGIDFSLQDAFPHDVLMDLNGGLSFRKGCYVGQEVVSRMQHRGTARKRLVLVSADSDLPETGTVLLAGGKPIGTLGSVSANRGLAIVRIDRAGEAMASDTPILAGELPVALALPAWSGLSFPSKADEATA
ncbi:MULTISPECIES: CAF17-like 4Fe-4S cluster assembly/insertion protein YgfZ [unclassified Rhizobium]|uniref:CAF17-like 4Fe-4S cluster assembly/insertion protein YgfZ n=1 Tax=unclassified Rhizobium TaxID=2613769 RepID=UPI001ADA5227|nr:MULTISPECIES: folate-binding protein YgfZ [unclassified Rhizobium]MBO9097915.1 folate-binding protein YgfZ [Rhizobium sp. L58/93]MBO9133302.1 folate-binding protein YgfZ [Rhizobium sp. B209b/85]MBO9168066.1 folate-binding protein YgfZ [Rhizobium sp. L245/93]MBO9184111.1 folate-binding protein YgfZ [Rhizobium sp. E27B/91]QXZ84327.1 folate-binding protein YgfZ [Rhizobium sp. K1/93]